MSTILEDLLPLNSSPTKYVYIFSGILRRADELEKAGEIDIAEAMRWRVESLAGDPAYCASVVRDYPNVTMAVTHLENWIKGYYRRRELREC